MLHGTRLVTHLCLLEQLFKSVEQAVAELIDARCAPVSIGDAVSFDVGRSYPAAQVCCAGCCYPWRCRFFANSGRVVTEERAYVMSLLIEGFVVVGKRDAVHTQLRGFEEAWRDDFHGPPSSTNNNKITL